MSTPGSVRGQFVCATQVRFQFIGLHKDDGSKGPGFTPDKLAAYVAKANELYGAAGLTFAYDQALDWEEMNSTLLWHGLRAYNGTDQDQIDADTKAGEIARQRPGKIVVFFREDINGDYAAPRLLGAKPPDTGWNDGLDYISYWGSSDHPNPDFTSESNTFAHELGHYLGLYHTFPSTGSLDTSGAVARAATAHPALSNGVACSSDADCVPGTRCTGSQCLDTFDGDLISDTPEDPSPGTWLNGCSATNACPQATKRDCSCAPFTAQRATRIATSIACTAASDCGAPTPASGVVTSCDGGHCSFDMMPSLDNVMSYYPACGPMVTRGQLLRIQDSITSVPVRNVLCNAPCARDLHDATDLPACEAYWNHREACGAENQRCCYPGGSCQAGLDCLTQVCRKKNVVDACNGCTSARSTCLNRCANDEHCKCLCENTACDCRTQNSCSIACPIQSCP